MALSFSLRFLPGFIPTHLLWKILQELQGILSAALACENGACITFVPVDARTSVGIISEQKYSEKTVIMSFCDVFCFSTERDTIDEIRYAQSARDSGMIRINTNTVYSEYAEQVFLLESLGGKIVRPSRASVRMLHDSALQRQQLLVGS